MKHYVYNHIDPITNQVKYVGKGSGNRAYETKYRRSPPHLQWTKELLEQGLCPIISIVAFFNNENDAYDKETELIYQLTSEGAELFNRTPGGKVLSGSNNPMYGKKRPDTAVRNKNNKGKTLEEIYGKRAQGIKNKMGLSGDKNSMFGQKRPDLSTRNAASKGKTFEELYGQEKAIHIKQKIGAYSSGSNNPMYGRIGDKAPCYGRTGNKHPMYGKNQTNEAKGKISHSLKLSRGKPIVRSDGKIYICLIDAARDLGLKDQKEVTKVLKGLRSHINGFTFQYVSVNTENPKQS